MSSTRTRIAVASGAPGGMGAPVSAHFGHADSFTLMSIGPGEREEIQMIPNNEHGPGLCAPPVDRLRMEQVTELLVGGIGGRPLAMLNDAGIRVYRVSGPSVRDAITEHLNGKSVALSAVDACGGHSNRHD